MKDDRFVSGVNFSDADFGGGQAQTVRRNKGLRRIGHHAETVVQVVDDVFEFGQVVRGCEFLIESQAACHVRHVV